MANARISIGWRTKAGKNCQCLLNGGLVTLVYEAHFSAAVFG